ncbi:restriction endonuclease subunit S [Francisella philomiragia]|uniref:restriction endonuclease subunit S n=1 Tax=Francisella philomiragia TaxID=28110 RepID=UPI000B58E82F|nr:restriction endonuclease subunit S [Francisella philomiragia]MBK2095159.1 restriction endonuclease subunit S [Francisella philomiragia]
MQKIKCEKVPKLRFKEFSGEWVEKKLGDTLKIGSGRDYKHLKNGEIPVYGTGGYMLSVDDYLYDGQSVCIGRKGTIDKPMFLNGKFWTVDTLFYTYSFNGSIPKFIYLVFQNISWKIYNEASGVPSLSKATIEKIKINLPTLPEQQKIADCLSTWDDSIENLKLIIENKKLYKKGMRQKVFSQEIRFKDDDGADYPDWEENKLGDVCYKSSSNLSANSLGDGKGDYPIFGATGYLQNIETYQETEDYISIVKDGAGVGRVLLCKAKSSVLGTLDKILVDKQKNNLFFTYLLLLNLDFKKYMIGSTIPHIYFKDYSKEKVKLPCLAEQTKIANFLSAIDEEIELLEHELEQLQLQKKGLMQGMFV